MAELKTDRPGEVKQKLSGDEFQISRVQNGYILQAKAFQPHAEGDRPFVFEKVEALADFIKERL